MFPPPSRGPTAPSPRPSSHFPALCAVFCERRTVPGGELVGRPHLSIHAKRTANPPPTRNSGGTTVRRRHPGATRRPRLLGRRDRAGGRVRPPAPVASERLRRRPHRYRPARPLHGGGALPWQRSAGQLPVRRLALGIRA